MRSVIMKSNFFSDYRSKNCMSVGLLWDNLFCSGILCLFILLLRFIVDVFFFNLSSTFGSMLLFSVIVESVIFFADIIGEGIYLYFNKKDNRYAFFNTTDLKKWYALTPEKFVFSSKGSVVYYIHNEKSVATYKYRENGFEKYYLDTTKMYPKTLFEAFKYRQFVNDIFKVVDKEEKCQKKKLDKIRKQKDIIMGNNEMLRVMGSIQKDIDRVMTESNQRMKEETDKLVKLNGSV